MCLYPKLVKNPKYRANKKNRGIVPLMTDPRVTFVPVGCQKCIECRRQKAREWTVRLLEDIKQHKNGKFVTLSFSNEAIKELSSHTNLDGYNLDNEIARKAVRRFLERWRKKHKKSLRHWIITELGENNTERIHLHGILFTDKPEDIKKIWKYGHVYIGEYVNEHTTKYITKYMTKTDFKHKEYQPAIFTSAGIGSNYLKSYNSTLNKFKNEKTIETYYSNGHKISLPTYYRNKIYSEQEREQLWLYKLDKEKRYILGNEIDISKGEDEYYASLEEFRKLNKRLGYGDNSINWDRKMYENQRRNLIKLQKIWKKNPKSSGEQKQKK